MKIQKLANDLKLSPDEVIAAAVAVGIAEAKKDTDISDSQRAAIETYLVDGAAPDQATAGSDGDTLATVKQMVVQITRERVLQANLKPQVERMIDAALEEYRRNGTTPANPLLAQCIPMLAGAERAQQVLEVGAITLPEISLVEWANDPNGGATSLLLSAEPQPLVIEGGV